MQLQIAYYAAPDILLLQNGRNWNSGGNVVKDVIAYVDSERNPVAIEVSGAGSLLRHILFGDESSTAAESRKSFKSRPNEIDLDRVSLPLRIKYDRGIDVLTMECGLPTKFEQAIADGLTAYYDGEDEHGKFINSIRLENAAKLLKPYLTH